MNLLIGWMLFLILEKQLSNMKKQFKKQTESTIKPKPKHQWSEYQKAIFKDIAGIGAAGNTIIIARAGSAKTSSLVEGSKYIPRGKKSLFCAFNKSIQEELKSKLGSYVECLTLHSLGLRAIKLKFGNNVELNDNKCWEIVSDFFSKPKENFDLIDNICKTVAFCKANLVDTPKEIEKIIDQYDIELCELEPKQFIVYVAQALRKCKEITNVIDFNDMIWFPFVYRLNPGKYDYVFIDESQDLNKCQIELALSAVRSPGGRVIAVLDNFQCVDQTTTVRLENEVKSIKDIKIGDKVESYQNGKITFNRVLNKSQSDWKFGYQITTASNKKLIMSPNHKIWAEQQEVNNKFLIYLMYRQDLGFRIGKTNKWKSKQNHFGARAIHEQADKLWVLDIVDSNEEAILLEEIYSLKYGIPTSVFNALERGLNQDRINKIFENFGKNGFKCLEDKFYDFNYPHWIGRSMSASNRKRLVVRLISHSQSHGSIVFIEFSDLDIAKKLNNHNISYTNYKRRPTDLEHFVVKKQFKNYIDAIKFAKKLQSILDCYLTENISFGKEDNLRLLTASQLFPGMQIISIENGIPIKDEILKIDKVDGVFFDIEVENSSNFIGNQILSHNCIYSWRGADSRVLDNLRERLKPKELSLPICYRCPKLIVEEAKKFVPDIIPYEKSPDGKITEMPIWDLMKTAKPGSYVVSRYNAPLIKHCLKFLKNGIPANMLGRDIGNNLLFLIKKSKKKNIKDFLKWVDDWGKEEKEKLLAKYPKANTDTISDKIECMYNLCDGASTLEEVKSNINDLFQDNDETKIVLFSSVHKIKGKETDKVFVLADTLQSSSQEELNIHYVAITRAKKELFMVWNKMPDPELEEEKKRILDSF